MSTTQERIVTIFGGSKCGEDCTEYTEARRVGQLLAEAGFTICTGGYLGVMEAASRGAHERGGRVLGIVMNQFKKEPNRFLTDKVATPHFYDLLLGDCWPPIIEAWRKHLVVSDEDVRILDLAATPEEAVGIIVEKSKGVSV
jgi:hypothetical protein